MDPKFILRGSNLETLTKEFKKSKLYKMYHNKSNELFIGIRNGYINVYYRGCSIGKLYITGNTLVCETAKKYLGINASGYTNVYSADEIADKFIDIRARIDNPKNHFAKNEKTAQQRLILNNNSNSSAEYYCIDMEYIEQRISNNVSLFGRFDIIAISRQKPYKVALIELKYGTGAIADGKDSKGKERSGVAKHAEDYLNFLRNSRYENHLKEEICLVVAAYQKFNIPGYPFMDGINTNELQDIPEVYFITVNANDENKARTVMRHYIHECKGCSKTNNAEHRLGFDVSKPNDQLYVKFLFSENDGSGIYDIINGTEPDGRYLKGIE